MKSILALFVLFLCGFIAPAETAEVSKPREYRHVVMTWVPPYATEKSRARLNEDFGGIGMKDTLTHLALQFWVPTKAGGIERTSKYGKLTDETIAGFRTWTRSHGIRLMLCVYNGVDGWDWTLARSAFAEHPGELVNALVSEMERLDLDGIDIDLEGNGSLDGDRKAFTSFCRLLSERLHPKGRQLTVDSFSHIWNAPNQTWWLDLLPLVDALTTMGYEETGARAKQWRSYSAQKKAAGEYSGKLLLGLPSNKDRWQDESAGEQIHWIADDKGTGLAFWDAQIESPAWRKREVWSLIQSVRDGK